MTTPTVTELVRNGNRVGQRVELARYSIPAGERVLHGQRINGVVRFLPGEPGVLVWARTPARTAPVVLVAGGCAADVG
jgi:hypothetical protein